VGRDRLAAADERALADDALRHQRLLFSRG